MPTTRTRQAEDEVGRPHVRPPRTPSPGGRRRAAARGDDDSRIATVVPDDHEEEPGDDPAGGGDRRARWSCRGRPARRARSCRRPGPASRWCRRPRPRGCSGGRPGRPARVGGGGSDMAGQPRAGAGRRLGAVASERRPRARTVQSSARYTHERAGPAGGARTTTMTASPATVAVAARRGPASAASAPARRRARCTGGGVEGGAGCRLAPEGAAARRRGRRTSCVEVVEAAEVAVRRQARRGGRVLGAAQASVGAGRLVRAALDRRCRSTRTRRSSSSFDWRQATEDGHEQGEERHEAAAAPRSRRAMTDGPARRRARRPEGGHGGPQRASSGRVEGGQRRRRWRRLAGRGRSAGPRRPRPARRGAPRPGPERRGRPRPGPASSGVVAPSRWAEASSSKGGVGHGRVRGRCGQVGRPAGRAWFPGAERAGRAAPGPGRCGTGRCRAGCRASSAISA